MRNILLLLLALLVIVTAPATMAGPPDLFIRAEWSETQSLTRAAPTLSTEGVSTSNAASITFVLEAVTGTLSGGGSLAIWVYDLWDGTNGAWAPFPARDITVPAACSGKARCVLEAYTVDGPRLNQRWLAATSGVTVSSGTTVTVRAFVTKSGRSISQ